MKLFPAWVETFSKLIDTLELENNTAIDWFTKNKNEMIINPGKFQAIILDRKKSNLTNIPLTIDNQTIKSFPTGEILGIHLGDKSICILAIFVDQLRTNQMP